MPATCVCLIACLGVYEPRLGGVSRNLGVYEPLPGNLQAKGGSTCCKGGYTTRATAAIPSPLVIGDHRRDLRLLQHDLRHPHPVGKALRVQILWRRLNRRAAAAGGGGGGLPPSLWAAGGAGGFFTDVQDALTNVGLPPATSAPPPAGALETAWWQL